MDWSIKNPVTNKKWDFVMCIRLVEAWTLEVKKIASCPSFQSKLFLAHNVFNLFHMNWMTSPFAWMYMYIQVQMYKCKCKCISSWRFTHWRFTHWQTHTRTAGKHFKLGASTQALTLIILHVDFDCVLWWICF